MCDFRLLPSRVKNQDQDQDGTDRLSRNVGNKLLNNPEGSSSYDDAPVKLMGYIALFNDFSFISFNIPVTGLRSLEGSRG